MTHLILAALLIFQLLNPSVTAQPAGLSRKIQEFLNNKGGETSAGSDQVQGKRWALLVAGSNGYENYRHQADVCHAYQILKKGGLADENIIVFMYDDIALNVDNPRRGVIINSPHGQDVYKGVPKDYTGNETNINNLFAVILGNKTALKGGSGKVLNTGPLDDIFIFYSDHGAVGLVGMPTDEMLYADALNKVLIHKHKNNGYKSMLFYLEACEAGSMFQGLLPENLNIYATTASNAVENSYATYCSVDDPSVPEEFDTCLGDKYSVAWMEDSEKHDSRSETLDAQYQVVKRRALVEGNGTEASHVMKYGNRALGNEFLSSYIGVSAASNTSSTNVARYRVKSVNQRDADLYYYSQKFKRAPKGSKRRIKAKKQLQSEIKSRKFVDDKIQQITTTLAVHQTIDALMHSTRPARQPAVDDWSCLRALVKTYQMHCGPLSSYGLKYARVFANMCNAGIGTELLIAATEASCK